MCVAYMLRVWNMHVCMWHVCSLCMWHVVCDICDVCVCVWWVYMWHMWFVGHVCVCCVHTVCTCVSRVVCVCVICVVLCCVHLCVTCTYARVVCVVYVCGADGWYHPRPPRTGFRIHSPSQIKFSTWALSCLRWDAWVAIFQHQLSETLGEPTGPRAAHLSLFHSLICQQREVRAPKEPSLPPLILGPQGAQGCREWTNM